MEKMQILFPEPQIMKLRKISKIEDRPVSELVRTAVDFWLTRRGTFENVEIKETPPTYGCGKILISSDTLRDEAWQTRIEKHEQF